MKAKKIYYSIVVGLQSLFILLLFVNIGYCIITSDLTMFPTTALYLNFYPFMNFFKTHNPYDLIVFISLLLLLFAMHFATICILFKKVKRIYAWVVIVNAYFYALTIYSDSDLVYVLEESSFLIYGYCNVAMFFLLLIAALLKLYRKRVHINSSLADDYFLPNEEDNKPEDKCDGIIQACILAPIFQIACFAFSLITKYYGSLLENYLFLFYIVFMIVSICILIYSYREYKKVANSNQFSDDRIKKVEKYIKIQPITFALFLASAVLIFAFCQQQTLQ